jgi:Na+-translocating ferredoxin:NAD+ oxidoreductase RnfE subunit
MIFLRKIVIFHTKYPKKFRASLRSAQFLVLVLKAMRHQHYLNNGYGCLMTFIPQFVIVNCIAGGRHTSWRKTTDLLQEMIGTFLSLIGGAHPARAPPKIGKKYDVLA